MQLAAFASEGYVNCNHVLKMIPYLEENGSKKIACEWTGWQKLKFYYVVLMQLNSGLNIYVFLSVIKTEYLTHIYASCSLDEARLQELATPMKPLDKPLVIIGASYVHLSQRASNFK